MKVGWRMVATSGDEMPFYNEVWSNEYNIRIAKLERGTTFHHGSRMLLSYIPSPVLGTPLPRSAIDTRNFYERPNSMQAGLRRVVDPQLYIDDFQVGQADDVETDYNALYGQHETVVFRNVMTVQFTEPMTLATLIADMQRWAPFFEQHGWLPDDPQTIYEAWCEANDVQPVASTHQRYPGTQAAIQRLRIAFQQRGLDSREGALDRISNRMAAASSSDRAYREGMHRLTGAILEWRPHMATYRGESAAPIHAAIQTWLDADQIADLRIWDMTNRLDTSARSATSLANPFDMSPEPDYIPRTPRATPAPPSADVAAEIRAATAAIPGVRIPTFVPGRRAINLDSE
jgi:hypothetical protein